MIRDKEVQNKKIDFAQIQSQLNNDWENLFNYHAEDVIPFGTFEVPRFYLKRGSECGYHCHLYLTIKKIDTGIVLTMKGEDIYWENHRVGKVKKSIDINRIGEKAKFDIIERVNNLLDSIPQEARRQLSKKANLLKLDEDRLKLELEKEKF